MKQFSGSGEQDKPTGSTEDDAVEKTYMAREFEFNQTFQDRQSEIRSLGNMTCSARSKITARYSLFKGSQNLTKIPNS